MRVPVTLGVAVCLAVFPIPRAGGQERCDPPTTYVAEPVYETIGPFSEGLALAAEGDRVGYMDTGGTVVIPARFDGGGTFSGGLAVVKVGGKWGVIAIPAGR